MRELSYPFPKGERRLAVLRVERAVNRAQREEGDGCRRTRVGPPNARASVSPYPPLVFGTSSKSMSRSRAAVQEKKSEP